MKLISHRGNTDGPNPLEENRPEYIDLALKMGYDVEIDLRLDGHEFYLGHDEGQYCVPMLWLVERKDNLWIHCKDLNSLSNLSNSLVNFNYFWHQNDDFTLTSKKYIWTYPGKQFSLNSIIVVPESNTPLENLIDILDYDCFGVCSDYLNYVKN